MKKLTLIFTLLGIFALFILLNFQAPLQVDSPKDLTNLPDNTKVQVQGQVVSESLYQSTRILKLDNNIEAVCNICPSYINRTLTLAGVTETYQNRTQIQVLRVTLSSRA